MGKWRAESNSVQGGEDFGQKFYLNRAAHCGVWACGVVSGAAMRSQSKSLRDIGSYNGRMFVVGMHQSVLLWTAGGSGAGAARRRT